MRHEWPFDKMKNPGFKRTVCTPQPGTAIILKDSPMPGAPNTPGLDGAFLVTATVGNTLNIRGTNGDAFKIHRGRIYQVIGNLADPTLKLDELPRDIQEQIAALVRGAQ